MTAIPFPLNIPGDPLELFSEWYKEAITSSVPEYDAMTLATSAGNKPSARIVLLKAVEKNGFVFFTNYDSRKGSELNDNRNASLVFYWKELGKQVRIEGVVEKVTGQESDEYFNSRPRGSQIGAWASSQSRVIHNRDQLMKKATEYDKKFFGKKIPRPPDWGGYRLMPVRMEFWIAGENRLHDRLAYIKNDARWEIQRLAP